MPEILQLLRWIRESVLAFPTLISESTPAAATLGSALRRRREADHRWRLTVLMAVREASPFRILFGREPNRFLDYIWGDPAVIDPKDAPESHTTDAVQTFFNITK